MRRLFALLFLTAAGCGNPWPAPQVVLGDGPADARAAEKPAAAPEDDTPIPADPDAPAVRAPTGRIKLPADGGTWPAAFAPAPPPVEGKAVPLALEYGVHAMVVSPESGRFVIAQVLGRRIHKSHPNTTRFVLGDVVAGKVLKEWETPGHYEPLDLSPDGTRFVVKSLPWADRTLIVFTVGPDFKLSARDILAHEHVGPNPKEARRNDNELHIRWAGFLGNTRVASVTEGGQVCVFKADSLDRVGVLDGTPGLTPCVTPDRKRLLAHAGGKAVLIDPAEGEAVATRAWPLAAGPTNLAASPDGATLAAAKQGRVRFLAVKGGQVWDQIIPDFGENGMPAAKFSWSGPGALVHGRKVYDPAVSYMVWHCLGTQTHADAYSSRQVWVAARLLGDEAKSGPPIRVAVRAYDAVPPNISGIVAAGKVRPGIYNLPAGATVRADATLLPVAKEAAARAAFEENLRGAGYAVSPTATAVFTLSLDAPVTKTTTFNNVPNVSYKHQPIRVQFRAEGKAVWDRAVVKHPPGFLKLDPGETLAGKAAAEGWGEPNYEGLKALYVPPHLPGRAFPREGFGFTELTPDGPVHRVSR